jgi:LmbE family N-acetylglucosaminyl deacetylase
MKKIIFGIFAHPDDEAFGPAGTLLLETKSGTDLHLFSLTAGDAGTNPDGVSDLATVREKEWREAGRLIGANSMELFGYKDGQLNNQIMIEAAERIIALATETIKDEAMDVEVEFMTLDLNGYTGHIDLIVAARAACLAFYRLKKTDTRFTRIRFACLPNTLYPTANTDWIYMEAGRTASEINETIDARSLQDEILSIMKAHYSQRGDAESAIKSQGENLGLNYFIVKT